MTNEENEMPDLKLSSQLCFAMYSAANAVTRAYQPLLTKLGLTYPQYLAMLVLWEEQNLTVKAIGEKLNLDSGTLTPLLKRLETAGLVERRRDRRDERQVRIVLTDKGTKLRAEAADVPVEIACATGSSSDENIALREILLTIRDNLLASLGGKEKSA